MSRLALSSLLALICSLALAPAGDASFPGKNGPLVLSLENCHMKQYLARLSWRGGELEPITERCEPADDPEAPPPSFDWPEAAPGGGSLLATRGGSSFVTLNPDGSEISPVQLPEEIGLSFPSGASFAPSGRRFAFESDFFRRGHDIEPLWEAQLDGSSTRRVASPMPCSARERHQDCSAFENPRWSPDGRLIAVEVETYGETTGSGLWLVRARDGKPVRRIGGERATDAEWSPDGRRIVYSTGYGHRERHEGALGGNLYVVNRDGKNRRTLVHREDLAETEPTWSPDGRWIAWVSLYITSGDVEFHVLPSLWIVRARGGTPRKIQDLPEPDVDEGEYVRPHLTWLAQAG